MLRFGQLIDFEQLDAGSAQDKGQEEIEMKHKSIEKHNQRELDNIARHQKGLKETLLSVTQVTALRWGSS